MWQFCLFDWRLANAPYKSVVTQSKTFSSDFAFFNANVTMNKFDQYNFGREVLFTNHKALSAKNTTGFNIFKVQVYLT